MLLYDAICRPGGQLTHEVPKSGLTAPEVILLRQIHGDDGVVHIKRSKQESAAGVDELDRLSHLYGNKVVSKVFGASYGTSLPQEIPAEWLNGSTPDAEDEPEDEPVRRGPGRPKKVQEPTVN